MPHIVIETARLHLRPFAPADLHDLHRLWTEPEVRQYLFDGEIIPRARVAEEIAGSLERFERHGCGLWSAFPRGERELIGFCGYRFFHQPPEQQLLYGFAPTHWGCGLATEVVKAMIRYGFEELALTRIVTSADAVNTASLRVMEKAGMTFEKRVMIGGLDTIYYTLPREAFQPDDAPYLVRRA